MHTNRISSWSVGKDDSLDSDWAAQAFEAVSNASETDSDGSQPVHFHPLPTNDATARLGATFRPESVADGRAKSTPSALSPECPSTVTTDTPNRQNSTQSGGLDALHISIYGEFSHLWNLHRTHLERGKKLAQAEHDSVALMLAPKLRVFIAPGGKGRGLAHSEWVLNYRGIMIRISDRQRADELHNVFVEIQSMPLMEFGLEGCVAALREVLDALGYRWRDESISRVDVCADVPNVTVQKFAKAVHNGRVITRANKRGEHNRLTFSERGTVTGETQTLEIGKKSSATFLRIYDKLEESKRDEYKRHLCVSKRWGTLPDSAVRVEFQLRREAVRKAGIKTLKDLSQRVGSLCAYLTHDWFRITARVPDRGNGHQRRFASSALWKHVSSAFQSWTGGVDLPREAVATKGVPEARLLRQGVGVLSRVLASRGVVPSSSHEAGEAILKLVVSEFGDDVVWMIREKRERLEAVRPLERMT